MTSMMRAGICPEQRQIIAITTVSAAQSMHLDAAKPGTTRQLDPHHVASRQEGVANASTRKSTIRRVRIGRNLREGYTA